MKILFLNNYHYLRGGSEQVYFNEMGLLRSYGHEVDSFARKSEKDNFANYAHLFPYDIVTAQIRPKINAVITLKEILYSSSAKKQLKKLIKYFTPDVVHAHNIYYRLTTSVLDLLREEGIPMVMTLHDYKLICPNYMLMYDNRICEDCKGGKFYNAILNRCYKNSMAASIVYSFESWFNDFFQKYKSNIDYFIAPSQFIQQKMIDFDWPEKNIEYIPNYVQLDKFIPHYESENYFLYIGRLSPEKGIYTLLNAFIKIKSKNIKLKIVGDGPERKELERFSNQDLRIEFTGYLKGKELAEITKSAKAIVLPSEWYENAPISILEAFAYGKPVIGSKIGGIPEMIIEGVNGLLFESGNVEDLTSTIDRFLNLSNSTVTKMGKSARQTVQEKYNPIIHYNSLISLYRKAIGEKRS
ncbi:MAG: glycosyltransferase family 4 protein [Desulfamplus sp.]|nr:glycosyltransferase family 4 protein [Desulfamplus sp.]